MTTDSAGSAVPPPSYVPSTAVASAAVPPVAPPLPPAGGRRRRAPNSQPTSTSALVAAVLTFVQAVLGLVGTALSFVTVALIERDLDNDRSVDEPFDLDDDGFTDDEIAGMTSDGSGSDFPWDGLLIGGTITLVITGVLVLLGVQMLRGRRWAPIGLSAAQLLLAVGVLVRLVQDPSYVGPALILGLGFPIAILVCLAVTALRRPRAAQLLS